jgi:hypothetical protein
MNDSARKQRARTALESDLKATQDNINIDSPGKLLIYDNQKEVGLDIVHSFLEDNVYLAILIAEMQVGKTGACLATAYYMCTHPDDNKVIDKNNVVIITGLSDTDWKEQTQISMISSFKENVFHRGNFKNQKMLEKLKYGNNMLIIIDESHIATQISQQMSLLLKETDILNIDNLQQRNIKILQISATPSATLQDALEWGSFSKVFKLQPSIKYIGFQKLKYANKIHDALDLSKYENVVSIGNYISSEYNTPKYHIIRIKGSNNIEKNISRLCMIRGWDMINHNSQERWNADELETQPTKHTFILIKDFWRASKRLCDTHIGVVHENFVKKADANTAAQGLAGRCCGNNKQKPGKGTPTIFCNLKAIDQYINWINANGNYKAVQEYSSRDINVSKGKIKTLPTLNHHSNVSGLEVLDIKEESIYDFPVWNENNGFATIDEVKNFLKINLDKTVKLHDFYKIDGYELSTRLTNYYGKTKDQLTANDRLTFSDYNVKMAGTNIASYDKKGQNYMIYPVYPNKTSPYTSVRYYYSILKK